MNLHNKLTKLIKILYKFKKNNLKIYKVKFQIILKKIIKFKYKVSLMINLK